MLSFSDAAALAHAIHSPLPASAAEIITQRLSLYKASDLLDLTHLLILERGDDEQSIYEEIGFHPLINPLDGCRYGEQGFVPPWDWLSREADWFEMIITVGNDGFAYVLLIEDSPTADGALLRLCRECVANDVQL